MKPKKTFKKYIEFLKDPGKFRNSAVKIPTRALLIGALLAPANTTSGQGSCEASRSLIVPSFFDVWPSRLC